MSKFMKPETALARTVEDEKASTLARYKALEKLLHPPMELLRRLLVDSKKRNKPVPHRLRALASFKYAVEVQHKNARRERKRTRPIGGNALGL